MIFFSIPPSAIIVFGSYLYMNKKNNINIVTIFLLISGKCYGTTQALASEEICVQTHVFYNNVRNLS